MEKVKYKSEKTKHNCTMLFQVCTQNTIVIVSFEGNDKAAVGLNPCLNKRQIAQHTKKVSQESLYACFCLGQCAAYAAAAAKKKTKKLTAMLITIALVKKKRKKSRELSFSFQLKLKY